MRNWTPTHEIRRPGQPTVRVMLDEGRGYTEEEWRDEAPADYERDDDGKWLFQGQPFAGQAGRAPTSGERCARR